MFIFQERTFPDSVANYEIALYRIYYQAIRHEKLSRYIYGRAQRMALP